MDILAALNVCIAIGLLFCTAVIKYELVWPKVVLYGMHLLLIGCRAGGFITIFSGINLVIFIKIVIFIITILGAFAVTPAIARLGLLLKKSMERPQAQMGPPDEILKERGIIIKAAR